MEISSSNDFSEPECIFPSQVSVTNATYPLARQLLLTVNYKNLLDGDINDFLTSALANAQEQAQRTALVPIPDDTLLAQQTWLNGSSEPEVVFYDVTPLAAPATTGATTPARAAARTARASSTRLSGPAGPATSALSRGFIGP